MSQPVSMIAARDALDFLISLGRPTREAASFLSEQCYRLRLHAWAYVNGSNLSPFPHELWPLLMWFVLPNDDGSFSSSSEKYQLVGNWLDRRFSYDCKDDAPPSRSYVIQGLRFDRLELQSLSGLALTWSCQPIGAVPLANVHNGLPVQATEDDVRAWIRQQKRMSADKAFELYQASPLAYRIKRMEFRGIWKEEQGTKRGRPAQK